ncbi:peptide/nickel transport system permease protein [Angulomicrobium tetraedrale]|uniref:Peptide/nickel transport system permease protein n=1 Tax=Ancylobacter tetraedralis TaxID=217068 RepID=A0A839ZDJ2_9HYPH|nr:ABC transporter permease [Ancylobacter tetraedralis]MBB3772778.1 peptide/nickel transport system permease protein [Ancylobacter tetraedralis]
MSALSFSSFRRVGWISLPLAVGIAIVLFWLVVTFLAPVMSSYDPIDMVGRRLQAPSWQHWLGTDALGRDVLSRTLHGARHSLPIAVIVVALSVAIGALLGAISGFIGGLGGAAIMRLVDVTLSFPPMLLAMAVAASLGPGLENAAIAMVIVWWPVYARLMRAQVLEVREREHVEAAIAAGASRPRVLLKHILPLCWTPVLISATMDLGQVILLAASLSFIGLGAAPPTPEWGSMISDGAAQFYSWWVALGPGLAILTIVLGFNFVGDGLHDYFDPKSK